MLAVVSRWATGSMSGRLTFRLGIIGAMKGEAAVGASRPALYPRNQGSSRDFRLGSIITVGIPIRPGQ